ncbi:MAG: benzoate transporter [Paenibacillaceae bacterium]|jgi:benzoate membrane transport protein|nr:benzoate transporter [Paenibacillaceae bacterium]
MEPTPVTLTRNVSRTARDFSVSAVIAGLIAVMVSFSGPLLIIFQAARQIGLSDAQLSSWVWAISLGSGLTGMALSAWFRAPVILAWSTPGAVLLVSGWSAYSYRESIGAFVVAALIVALFGLTGVFSYLMKRIPQSVIAAMLSGILLKFGVDMFVSLKQLPALVLPSLVIFLLSKRFLPRYATMITLCLGLAIAYGLGRLDFGGTTVSMAHPILTRPSFSLDAIIGLGIPLAIVAMASQNATGIGVLRADGYNTPATPLVAVTGFVSLLIAPFGSHGINLAAITAAICTGKEAHGEPGKRYIAGIVCGFFYVVFGLMGATIVSVFSVFPAELIAVIAGVALLASMGSSLTSAMSDESYRDSALITFLVTISGITIAGIGAAFWGLLAGIGAQWILSGRWALRNRRQDRA